MEFALDPTQLELQQTVTRFFEDRFPLDGLVAREGLPLDRTAWGELADLGLFGVLDLGVLEAALVFEQVGSMLVPGPLLWTTLAAPLVDGAADGDLVVGGVNGLDGDGTALVEHASDLDALLVLHHDRVTLHADLAEPEARDPLDPLTPVSRVRPGSGEAVGDATVATTLRRQGTVLTAAALVGIAARALETARTHALERQQFGVPIGSFQAVKHLLADRFVATTLAQSSTYAAAALLDDPRGDDHDRAAASASLLATDAALDGAGTAIQVLGGMGFTWDMAPNHLLKRAWVLARAFGSTDDHATALGAALVSGAT